MVSFLAVYHLIFTTFSFTMCGCKDVESIRAVEGANVHLPCHSPPQDSDQVFVKWIKTSATKENICKLDFNKYFGYSNEQCVPHFTLNRTSFTLSIENVQLSDAGDYSCKTTKIIPPPSLDNISHVILQVEGLSLQLLNSSNESCIRLLCSLKSQNPDLVNFTWSRDGQNSLNSFTSTDTNSELHLCKPDWSEGDTIICNASYSSAQKTLSRNIRLNFRDEESSQNSPAFCVILVCTFIICIIFIWIFFCISKYKSVSCCSGPSTRETY